MIEILSKAIPVTLLVFLPAAVLADAEAAIEGSNEIIKSDIDDAQQMYNDIVDRANNASSAAGSLPTRPGPINSLLDALGYETGSAISQKILEDSKH